MWFRLALKLGSTVAELQDRMTSAEFGEWIAYYSLEPFGEIHDDIRMGTVASVIANCNRPSNTSKAFAPLDFMPWVKPDEVVKAPESAASRAEGEAARIFGINLTEIKASGKKQFVIRNPKSQ